MAFTLAAEGLFTHIAVVPIIQNIYPIKLVKNKIKNLGIKKIDYLKVLNINKIIRPYKKNKRYKIFIAYFLGSTRLIDNI